jgi:hypothetical protein
MMSQSSLNHTEWCFDLFCWLYFIYYFIIIIEKVVRFGSVRFGSVRFGSVRSKDMASSMNLPSNCQCCSWSCARRGEDEVNPHSRARPHPTYATSLSPTGIMSFLWRDQTNDHAQARSSCRLPAAGVAPPYTHHMQEMAVLEAQLGNNSRFKGSSEKEIRKIVKERVDILGPKVRDVFVKEESFNKIKRLLSENANKVFAVFDKISVDKMTSNSNKYIGAKIVKAGAFVPSLRLLSSDKDEDFYAIEFLSDHITKIVALACTEENYNKWTRSNIFKFDYLIAESIVTHCLIDQILLSKNGIQATELPF